MLVTVTCYAAYRQQKRILPLEQTILWLLNDIGSRKGRSKQQQKDSSALMVVMSCGQLRMTQSGMAQLSSSKIAMIKMKLS
ncbi:hypothetical protein CH337_20790 [Rhodoblastus acidophilus]|nr:hypothetical protein CKO16_22055 [Rhodoblastus acidophilus]RAI16539.1 hypothetical protein CH337_20790 [Rhodoblastus acidophilus]